MEKGGDTFPVTAFSMQWPEGDHLLSTPEPFSSTLWAASYLSVGAKQLFGVDSRGTVAAARAADRNSVGSRVKCDKISSGAFNCHDV